MPEVTYTYDITNDLPNGKVNPQRLTMEIQGSSIVTALGRVETAGGSSANGVVSGGTLDITFKEALSSADKTTLDGDTTNPAGGLLAAHDNAPSPLTTTQFDADQVGVLDGNRIVGGGRRQGYVSIDSASTQILATSYFFKPDEAQRSLKSLDANDTDGGSGAHQVRITYYDANMVGPFTEVVTLNGGVVATQNSDIRHVEKLEVVKAGSNGGNVGSIQMFEGPDDSGGLITTLAAGDNRTFHAQHFVAQDRVCFITEAQVGQELNSGKMLLNAQNPNSPTSPQVNQDISFPYPGGSIVSVRFGVPIRVEGPARVWMVASPIVDGVDTVHGAFGFFEVSK